MSWTTNYWPVAMRDVDDTEVRVERTWSKSAAAIAAVVWWLRRRVSERSIRLPIVSGGWIDPAERARVSRFRLDVIADVREAQRRLYRELGGSQGYMISAGRGSLLTDGITTRAIHETLEAFRPNWERLEAVRRRFEREVERALRRPDAPPSGPPGPRPTEPPPLPPDRPIIPDGITTAKLAEIEAELSRAAKDPRTKSAREAADELEIGVDALANIGRNLRFDLERLYETTVRMTGSRSKPEGLREYMNGEKPWGLNENNMRLSTTAHIRGIHRRRTVTESTRAGITHFRLDLPRQRLGEIGQGSTLAPLLWTVRPLSEWHAIGDRLNSARKSASSFDTLGFFHNDPSYVVPVPPVFMTDAIEHGRRLREKWGFSHVSVP